MKPISVRFTCFGPYMAEQTVDFTTLGRNGLFLICGETGSGKTTMLDAMCYALYGASSGGTRGDLAAMRCKLAGREDETLVEFIFESGAHRYRFTRALNYGKRSSVLKEENGAAIWRNGVWEPLVDNPTKTNVNRKAEELIGLSADQFRQVIILPQGRFERLLTSDSTEKESILVSLFRADRWQRIVDIIKDRVNTQNDALKVREGNLKTGLSRYGCTNVQALAMQADERAAALTGLTAAYTQADAAFTARQTAHGTAQRLNDRFGELARRTRAYQELLTKVPGQDTEDALLARAAQAERLAPSHSDYLRVCKDLEDAIRATRGTEATSRKASLTLAQAEKDHAEHEQGASAQEQRKAQLVRYQGAVSAYQALEQATKAGKDARTAQDVAQETAKRTAAAVQEAQTKLTQCAQAQQAAMESFSRANEAYLAGICGTLAAGLISGKPCPVCGSEHHPAPAAQSAAPVTDADVKRLKAAWEQADTDTRAADAAYKAAQEKDVQAQKALQDANHAMELAEQAYRTAQQQCIDGIRTEAALNTAITRLTKEIRDFDDLTEQLRKALDGARVNAATWQTNLHNAQEQQARCQTACDAQAETWQRMLEDAGFADEAAFRACLMDHDTLQRRQAAAQKFRNDLDAARKEAEAQQAALAGQTVPDMAAEDRLLREADEARKAAQTACTQADTQLKDLQKDLATLKKLAAETEQERLLMDENLTFVKHLVGSRDTSLQRYVLSVMLSAITEQANLLLRNIHGGRYRLYRSGEGKGLDLEVLDSMSGSRRSVSTLSGGEKFLVSLSLAIGLSTVVQAQGASSVRMEALFIDEGFGSLDANSISDAMDVLATIQRSKGMVGIISHVDRLRETIPARVEVIKGRKGSTLRVVD